MISSRDVNDLHPVPRGKFTAFLTAAKAQGIDAFLTCTYRDDEAQNALFAVGRTKPGKKVTNARAGESYHQFRCAGDVAILLHGKLIWDDTHEGAELWDRLIKIGESVGLESASHWKNNTEKAHFQYTGGLSLADMRAGKIPQ